MRILGLIDLPQAVPISAFTGSTGMHDVIEHMNANWRASGTGVIFGEGAFADRYRAFTELVTNRERQIVEVVEKSLRTITHPDQIIAIESQSDLETLPPCMYIPMLTYAPVRELFETGQIRGWGVSWNELPEEDVVGRMINNGRFRSNDEEWMKDPESGVKYVLKTGDPNYTREELSKIESSREFIDSWLEEQLGPGGDHLDMSDLPNPMGRLRSPDGDDDK